LSAVDTRIGNPPPPRPSGFVERAPWEAGFSAYFAEWIAPELERVDLRVADAERRLRRRAPLLIGAWLILTLLVAEASMSVAITLLWAILIGIIGAWMARAPVQALRERAAGPLRDLVLGFFGLRRMTSGDGLARALRASPLAERSTAFQLDEQFWGIHQGMPFRMARLNQAGPGGRASATDRGAAGDDQGSGRLVLLIPAEPAGHPSSGGPPETDALRLLANALGARRLRHASCPEGLLILAETELRELDWSHLAETWDADAWRGALESAARALLARLDRVLQAAHGVSRGQAVWSPTQDTRRPNCEKI
jgi:hypothetical protein